jgi:hypothetical protein
MAAAAVPSATEAAPGAPTARLKAALSIEKAAYQRCYRHRGRRVCRWYRVPYREYGIPENYRTGSSRWWQEMDRTDRGGRGGRR